jgi:signal transduction histidine kinase
MQFLSLFVHQIINPLNGVIGTIDNLIDGTTPPKKRGAKLAEVRAQLEHAIDLIRNLAYLSSVTDVEKNSAIVGRPQPCVIPELIIQAAQYYQSAGLKRGMRIELSDPKTQYVVDGYPALLRQVFMNLFENSLKYSDEGSVVTITPNVQQKTGHLIIEVESFGVGFTFSERERIFELRYRGQEARNAVAAGAGLGLYIARQVMNAHNGIVEAEYSSKTRRTLFRLRFPNFRIAERL